MSNYPLAYKLSWLPRYLRPSLSGRDGTFAPLAARLTEAPAETVRLVFLGDISGVANRETPEIDPAIREEIASADVVIGNCESPVVRKPRSPIGTRLGMRHAMTPEFLDAAMAAAGIDPRRLILSVANNHGFDQGIDGFEETVATLAERGIRTAGLAANGLVAKAVAGRLATGFLAFTQWHNTSCAEFAGRVILAEEIGQLREADALGLDLLCALPHWDWEFRHFPRAATRMMARDLAAKGVRLIVGSHAHVVQPVERIGGTLAAYGLGDFLGTALPRQPWPGRIGALLAVDVSADETSRGQVAGYRLHLFIRSRRGRHERLSPVETLSGRMAERAGARIEAIFGDK